MVVVEILVIVLSCLITLIVHAPIIPYNDSYVSLSYITELRNNTLLFEHKAFNLAVTKQDTYVIKAIYNNRVQSETEMIDFANNKFDLVKSLALLILIIIGTTFLSIFERKKKYNKQEFK